MTQLDEFWHRKYTEDDEGRAVRRDDYDEIVAQLEHEGRNPEEEIELPDPSYFPFLVGFGVMLVAYGVVYLSAGFGVYLLLLGAVIAVGSFVGWSVEPLEEHHDAHEEIELDPEDVEEVEA